MERAQPVRKSVSLRRGAAIYGRVAKSSIPATPWRIALVALITVHAVGAAFHVYFGAMNADEGFYAIAARSVMQGDLPYRDFGYTQTPLLPYVNGPVLALAGYGLFEQRWVNGAWGALALLVAARWIARQAGWPVALATVATFTLSPAWMHHVHLGKTYAFTTLVVMLAAAVFVTQPGGARKQVLLGVLGVVGVGCRLPAAPFFAVLWLAAWWHDGPSSRRRIAAGLLGLVVPTVIVFGPFYALAPQQTTFWILGQHASGLRHRLWPTDFEGVLAQAPVWWAAFMIVGLVCLLRRRLPWSREATVVMAAVAALLPNLLPRGIYVEYATPFLLPLAAGLVIELTRLVEPWPRMGRAGLVAALAAVQVAAIPLLALAQGRVSSPWTWTAWLPSNVAPYTFDLPLRLGRARTIVERLLPPDAPLLGPNIILAAETGRAVPRNARMGPFTFTADLDAATAQALNLLTHEQWRAQVADPGVPLLAFFTTGRANYGWSLPSFRLLPADVTRDWLGLVRRDFLIVQDDRDFLLVARRTALPPAGPAAAGR